MVYWQRRMASSWCDLVGTSHYEEGPCVCPAHHLPPPAGLESTESLHPRVPARRPPSPQPAAEATAPAKVAASRTSAPSPTGPIPAPLSGCARGERSLLAREFRS